VYSKIYHQIYEGTLAIGPPEALTVFMHMLVMGYPNGIVDVHPGIIAQRTRLPLEFIETGIRALEQPDPCSRSPLEDGRRIIRLDAHRDWGWQIVNFKYYRDLQNEAAKREYNRKWMAADRAGQSIHDPEHQSTVDQCGDSKSKSKRKTKPSVCSDEHTASFEEFWKAYPPSPRKVNKRGCLTTWKSRKLHAQREDIMAGLACWKASEGWVRGKDNLILMPATFLNQDRWLTPPIAQAPARMADSFKDAIG
jgi:hypothetical protein